MKNYPDNWLVVSIGDVLSYDGMDRKTSSNEIYALGR